MSESEDELTIYRTSLVPDDPATGEEGVNYFTDVEDAREWLEVHIEKRFRAEPGEWTGGGEGDTERWTMFPKNLPEGFDGRCIVRAVRVWTDTEGPIQEFEGMLEQIHGGDPA